MGRNIPQTTSQVNQRIGESEYSATQEAFVLHPLTLLRGAALSLLHPSQAVIQGKANVPANARIPAPELESLVIGQIGLMLESLEKYLTEYTGLEREEILGRTKDLASRWSRDKPSVDDVPENCSKVGDRKSRQRLYSCRRNQIGRQPARTSSTRCSHRGKGLRRADHCVDDSISSRWSASQAEANPSLVRAIAWARDWYEGIVSGKIANVVCDLAKQTRVSAAYVQRILPCALLSPNVSEAILSGQQRSQPKNCNANYEFVG